MKFCSECGSELLVGPTKFCHNCGANLWYAINDSERREIEQPNIYSLGVKLEQMVEQILKTKGFSTERRLKLTGESGATHEIDVLAKRETDVLAVECKNYCEARSVGIKELRDFQSKIQDLPQINHANVIVTPYLNNGLSRHGDKISIERKSGKQRYTGAHFSEAVQHALLRGISYSIIVYDTGENVPNKTVFSRENGVLVAVVDIQSGTWQMARDMFEVLQKELDVKKKNVEEVKINMKVVQDVCMDITTLLKFTSNIRLNTSKIQNLTKKIDQETDEIKEAVNIYKDKLRSAIE